MFVTIVPWAVGARTGHYLLVLLLYRYNVNAGIQQLGHHNFGHPYLHFIDHIQNRYHELFNIQLFPRHPNLSQFAPVKDFVSEVGIGPVLLSEEYVKKGKPLSALTGNLKFMATQMKITCPPLPVCHRYESRIFCQFLTQHPQFTSQTWHDLAKEFLRRTNETSIFQKLPSMMLCAHHTKWQHNELIRQVECQVKDKANKTMEQLDRECEVPQEPKAQDQNHAIDGSAATQILLHLQQLHTKRPSWKLHRIQWVSDAITTMIHIVTIGLLTSVWKYKEREVCASKLWRDCNPQQPRQGIMKTVEEAQAK